MTQPSEGRPATFAYYEGPKKAADAPIGLVLLNASAQLFVTEKTKKPHCFCITSQARTMHALHVHCMYTHCIFTKYPLHTHCIPTAFLFCVSHLLHLRCIYVASALHLRCIYVASALHLHRLRLIYELCTPRRARTTPRQSRPSWPPRPTKKCGSGCAHCRRRSRRPAAWSTR